ncbi:hypothetical protein FKR81_12305 [Lentzea tibetensis]|uniref:TIGR02234 family membrane protein n=1 Tax=Lentzea tibetensis TaxID=2591470 RepID=A0A563EXB2_9PSEU|nr:hypothetical protein [Lentzea tibetensis]TWP52335.1 hypothetical protein FKR81_12305 [Lentzea tibetensis]
MSRRVQAVVALVAAVALALWGTTRTLSYLSIQFGLDQPRSEFFTTAWRTNFGGPDDPHSPLFGASIVAAALLLVVALAWPKKGKKLALAGTAMLAGVVAMLLVYLENAIAFSRDGNLLVDPALRAGYGDGIWFLLAAVVVAVAGTVLHPTWD